VFEGESLCGRFVAAGTTDSGHRMKNRFDGLHDFYEIRSLFVHPAVLQKVDGKSCPAVAWQWR
jgi:hypothetical protein